MKKLLIIISLVLLAAGCNTTQITPTGSENNAITIPLQNQVAQLDKDKGCQNYADAMSNKIGQKNTVYRIFYSQSLGKCLYAYELDYPINPKDFNPTPENTNYYFAIRDEVTFEPIFEKTFYGFDRNVYRYMSAGDFDAIINQYK